jgi:hypothetical protein
MFAVNLEDFVHQQHPATMWEQILQGQVGKCYLIHDFQAKKDTLISEKPPPY